jgi:membrane associated rhomboid family serine protease
LIFEDRSAAYVEVCELRTAENRCFLASIIELSTAPTVIHKKRPYRLETYLNQIQSAISLVKDNIPLALLLIGFLWGILIVNKLVGYRLNLLGIYPRHLIGLIGIPIHPLLHGGFNHLFFNSIPLFVLLTFVLTGGINSFICITLSITLISGFAIWLFGRRAIHIGASDLIMGYWGYLLVDAYQHPSILTYILAIICIYYFGGLLLSVFPQEERISWEGHLFGLIAGIATAFLCPKTIGYFHF